MEERSLRVVDTNKTFFGKLTSTISKIITPTKIGINSFIINMKRNSLIKAYDLYSNFDDELNEEKKKSLLSRYEESYSLYLEAIDKYVMDSIYKMVKNNTAGDFEKNAMSSYYTISSLKNTDYIEYKYRKQKYLIELDYGSLKIAEKSKILKKYTELYVNKMDSFYKGILKNYSVQLADNSNRNTVNKNEKYDKIFSTLEEYISKILPLKMKSDDSGVYNKIVDDYNEYEKFEVGKLDEKDIIEKNMILLGISRQIFTHSLPLIAAEQCYNKLLQNTRELIINTNNEKKKSDAYKMLITLIEDYNVKLLSTKIYWEKAEEREQYKKFWDTYKKTSKANDKEILFLKREIRVLENTVENKKILTFYKDKLVEFGAMKNLKDTCRTIEKKFYKKK